MLEHLGETQGGSPHPLLLKLIEDILAMALPERVWRSQSSPHHYTEGSIEIQVLHEGQWIEVMECGLIARWAAAL